MMVRRALLIIAALALAFAACWPYAAQAQLIRNTASYRRARTTGPGSMISNIGQRSAVVWKFDALASGAYFDSTDATMYCKGEDFNGTTLTCTTGGAWTTNGTVASNNATELYPNGFGATARKSWGPHTDSNYFSLGSGSDVLDFSGDFYICMVVNPTSFSGSPIDISNGLLNNDGYFHACLSNATCQLAIEGSGAPNDKRATSTNVATAFGLNVWCGGRASTTTVVHKLNRGNYASTGSVSTVPATTRAAFLGRYNGAGEPWTGTIKEVLFVSGTPTEAIFDAHIRRALGHDIGEIGGGVVVTRNGVSTYIPVAANAQIYNAATNTIRLTENGAYVEPAATNLEIQSNAYANAAWTKTNTTVTANSTVDPWGATLADTLTSTVNGGNVQGTGLASAAAVRYTASVWAKVASSTQAFALEVWDVTAGSAITTCTPTATTTWQRFTCPTTANATATNAIATRIYPGGTGGTGTILAADAQLEAGVAGVGYATSVIQTAAATITRVADVLAFTTGLTTSDFCLDTTATPEGGAFDGGQATRALFQIGASTGGANTAQFYVETDGSLTFDVYDNASALKRAKKSTALTGSAATRLTACASSAGTLAVYVNGVDQSATITGAGTGTITTFPGTSYLGSLGASGATNQFSGYLRRSKVSRSSNPARLF